MRLSLGTAALTASLIVSGMTLGANLAAAASACSYNQNPITINGATCCPEDLVEGPGGQGSVCPGTSTRQLGRYSYPPFDLLPHHGPFSDITSNTNPFEDLLLGGIGGEIVSGSGMHLGMYNSSAPISESVGFSGDGSYMHGTAISVTDAVGAVAPGSLTPGYTSSSGGGGIKGVIDVSKYFSLPPDQQLIFGAIFDLKATSTEYGTTPSLLAPAINSSGSVNATTYTPTIYGGYKIQETYFLLSQSVDWNTGNISNNLTGGVGDFNSFGYTTDLKIGHAFTLFGASGYVRPPNLITKGPAPSPVYAPTYTVKLDISGHAGYTDERSDSFTDSSGFIYGNDNYHYWTLGGTARLFAEIPHEGLVWSPYILGGIDQRVDFSHTFFIPAQGGNVADIYNYGEANTFWRTEVGLAAKAKSGLTAGILAYYSGSADTDTVGGRVFIKIPLE